MGLEAIDHRQDGTAVAVPGSREEWRDWVSPGRTRNHVMDDPLLDWLSLYGQSRDYLPKSEMSDYRDDLDFTQFIFAQGHAFEEALLGLLSGMWSVESIAESYRDISNPAFVEWTYAAMRDGAEVLYQPVLWDAEHRNFGAPDFLFRSDVLAEMFPEQVSSALTPAPDLDIDYHYIVVDSKFASLHFNAAGDEVDNGGSRAAYKVQLWIYNRMLARLQGYRPSHAFLLGRGWEQRSKSETMRGHSAFDRLGAVPVDGHVAHRQPIGDAAERALAWIRRLRAEGDGWELLPRPSVPELYPNMVNHDDGGVMMDTAAPDYDPYKTGEKDGGDREAHWVGVKSWLAKELGELTLLWNVGTRGRRAAHDRGIYRWDDPDLTTEAVEVGGPHRPRVLTQLLQSNATKTAPAVLPKRIATARDEWGDTPPLEFYIDFEFCSDLNDDFTLLPEKNGQPLIFMIGCGHVEEGEWVFESLVTDRLTEAEELRIIREWMDHMRRVAARLGQNLHSAPLIHWSAAELSSLERSYNSARVRHGGRADWPEDLRWFDFLRRVVQQEPVTVRGALGFGLKALAKSMFAHGLIETSWGDSPVDGLGAMVGAWSCEKEAERSGGILLDQPLMREIAEYNEVDCKVMMEIVRHLRQYH